MRTFLIMSLMLSIAIGIAGNKTKYKEIKSFKDLKKLYDKQVYPFNKLTDSTLHHLESSMVFDGQLRFRGFHNVGGLYKELTYRDNLEFDRYFGVFSEFSEADSLSYEILRKR